MQPDDADPGIAKAKPASTPQERLANARAVRAAKIAARNAAANAPEEAPEQITRAGVAPRANPRLASRSKPPREIDREPTREHSTVVGRNGEVLARRHTSVGDIFHVPEHEIPQGWDYQWNTVTVHNQQATEFQVMMHANGWRAVPAERHAGRWTAPGHTGDIIVKGMRLEERPTSLGNEARAEDIKRARTLMRDQTDSLRLTEKLPKGFESRRKYRGTGGDVRINIDRALDIPTPEYEYE